MFHRCVTSERLTKVVFQDCPTTMRENFVVIFKDPLFCILFRSTTPITGKIHRNCTFLMSRSSLFSANCNICVKKEYRHTMTHCLAHGWCDVIYGIEWSSPKFGCRHLMAAKRCSERATPLLNTRVNGNASVNRAGRTECSKSCVVVLDNHV